MNRPLRPAGHRSVFPALAALAMLGACSTEPAAEGGGTGTQGSTSAAGPGTDAAPTTQSPQTDGGVSPTGSDSGEGTTGEGTTGGSAGGSAEGTTVSVDGTDTGSSESGSSDEGSESTGIPADCDSLLPLPVEFATVVGPNSSEDFVFDAEGYLLNIENGDLLRAEYASTSTLVFPGVAGGGFAAGTAMLSDGSVVINSGNQVIRIFPDGTTEVIASGISYPNGLTTDLDDIVYVAAQSGSRVVRIDPETLQTDTLADGLDNPNGVGFDPGYNFLYVGSFGAGTVHRINMATNELELYASNIGGGGLDGLIVDACNNVYVTDFGPGLVFRLDPDGDDHELVANLPSGWIPNMHFGSGVGGWDDQRLYVMDIGGDQVYELDLGVGGITLPQF